MRFSHEFLESLKERADIVSIVEDYVRLKRSGDRYWGLSPFKTEKTPSFSVVPDKKFYHCFSTNNGGNVFTFLMKVGGLSFPEAVRIVAERSGVELPLNSTDVQKYENDKAITNLLARVGEVMHRLLIRGSADEARSYLSSRKVSSEIVCDYKIGALPFGGSWLYQLLKKKQNSDKLISQLGLFSRKNQTYCIFSNRLAFPIFNHRGEIVGFGGRLLSGNGPKYLNSYESTVFQKKENLYGLYQAKSSIRATGQAILVEGYFDVLALAASGISTGVAPLGTALTIEQARLLSKYASEVVVLFDGDGAGINAMKKSIPILESCGIRTKVLILENGKDPSLVYEEMGPDVLRALLPGSSDAFDYLLRISMKEMALDLGTGAELVVQQLTSFFDAVQSPIRKDIYLKKLSHKLNVSQKAIEAALYQ
jgi:DNA primase